MTIRTACPDCDLLVTVPALPEGARAYCPRCGASLTQGGFSFQLLLALTITGIIFWLTSLVQPLLILEVNGVAQAVGLWQGTISMLHQGEILLTLLFAMTTIVAPMLQLGIMLWLILPLAWRKRPWALGWLFRLFRDNEQWMMLEVFFLGVLVTSVKLSAMAQVVPGWSLLAFIGLMLTIAAIQIAFDVDGYWREVTQCT
ncbi:MAG: paraquat-inducible protein A [Proteobacteria bacterium]|nr:paraquat-inducible protein A [Pseudomonadota bacterium]